MRKGTSLDDDVMFSIPPDVCVCVCTGSPEAPEEPAGPWWNMPVDSGEQQVQRNAAQAHACMRKHAHFHTVDKY